MPRSQYEIQSPYYVTDYAVEQVRLNGNNPAAVVVPGLDR
jgi:hypothetical protein